MTKTTIYFCFILFASCNLEKPNYIDYQHFSDDKSLNYKRLLKDQIEQDKKNEKSAKNKKTKQFFQKYYVD